MDRVKIYAKTVEQTTASQIQEMQECVAYKDNIIRIMPDCHAGKGCTIGTVISIRDKVVPSTVGVDIGCGVLVVELKDININLQELDECINTYIPSGFNIHDEPLCTWDKLKFLHCVLNIDTDNVDKSIGSLGGGNHFIELNEDSNKNKYLVIHSGSRNLGVKVCKFYQNLAIHDCVTKKVDCSDIIESMKAAGTPEKIQELIKERKSKYPVIKKELSYLKGENLASYLHDMLLVQEYADLSRKTIAKRILQALNIGTLENYNYFTSVHNYIDLEHNILRKGAIAAYNNQRLIIPINMRDGSLICIGKGNIDWLYSAPHGAGRLMSRAKAKETLDLTDFKESMKGIYTTSVCKETIDEAPMVYKSMNEIIDCIKDTVEIKQIIKPIYNFKAKEQNIE
nr:MAG TPA: tRNA-splicing ligase RtcB [Caudoviricetes sp.]